jgi:hypothetical protein
MKNQASKRMKKTALRIFLLFSAFGWIICVAGVFLPVSQIFDLLSSIGGVDTTPLLSEPMFEYWLRMASSTFTLIGVGFLILAIRPDQFAKALPFAGGFMLINGIILLIHVINLPLPLTPILGDVLFCLIGGVGILLSMSGVKS